MNFAFTFSGIPDEVFDLVSKEGKFIAGGNTIPHFLRHGKNGTPYKTHDIHKLIEIFKAHIEKESNAEDGGICFASFYIDLGESNSIIEDGLFPFILSIPVAWSLSSENKVCLQQSKNELVRNLNKMCTEARKTLETIQRELVEQRQRTPWLLPVRNFKSRHLIAALYDLQHALYSAEKKQDALSRLNDAFRHRHPPQKCKEGRKGDRRYFVDDGGLEFKPPGHDMHGFHRASSGHNSICAISARRRLGAPYHRAFHYDCSKGEGATQLHLHSCHSREVALVSSEKHINIASNDYTRPEAKK